MKALYKITQDNAYAITGYTEDRDTAIAYQAQRHLFALTLLCLEHLDDNHRRKVYEQLKDIVVTFSSNG